MTAAIDLSPLLRHGGRLRAAEAAFPHAPRPWLDLSTGINPRPYPAPQPSLEALARLPDPDDVVELERRAAHAFGAHPASVAATPGTEAALRLLPRLIPARSVGLRTPSYGGHAEAWALAGAQIMTAEAAKADAWVVVNPNNPDGRITPPIPLAQAAERRWVIVDEAFADAEPLDSLAPVAAGRLVVLRSFGKFYGLAGVRLGFVVAEPALAQGVRRAFGDWPLSAGALVAGLAAYADVRWRMRTCRRLARDRVRLDALLGEAGLQAVGGTDLFRLVESPNARAVFLRLARAGVLCRPFSNPHHLRFGLPGRPADWDRLAAALTPETTPHDRRS